MISEPVTIFACCVTAALFVFSLWGQLAFAQHPRMPNPFSIDMDASRHNARFMHVWLNPLVALGSVLFTGYLLSGLPEIEELNSSLDAWALCTTGAFACLHAFALWRLNRWTLAQP